MTAADSGAPADRSVPVTRALRPPTAVQLAAIRRVRDERIACVCFRSYREQTTGHTGSSTRRVATYAVASFRNAYAPIDADGRIVGPEIRFDVMTRLEVRGWVQLHLPDDPIVTVTEAGHAVLAVAEQQGSSPGLVEEGAPSPLVHGASSATPEDPEPRSSAAAGVATGSGVETPAAPSGLPATEAP